jgi:hypothetical protein
MTIRHNCETDGCFIKEQTPDWGFTDSAFSGRIRVGDIDGIVEANGCLLIMEWKGIGVPTPVGQKIMFEKATKKNHLTVFVINGDPVETIVDSVEMYFNGNSKKYLDVDNKFLWNACRRWEKHARSGG